MKTKIIALMGKAGAGKDLLLKAATYTFSSQINEIVSCTTRPIREKEVDGINYHFLTEEEFANRVNKGDLIESTEFNGWYYGTLFSSLSNNKLNIGVFNPTGVLALSKREDIDLVIFYITCPDKVRLLRQLNRENNPNCKEIIRRYSADEQDFEKLNQIPDYIEFENVELSDVDRFVQTVGKLI